MMIKYFSLGTAMVFIIISCSSKVQNEYYESGKIKNKIIVENDEIKRLRYYEEGGLESEGKLLSNGYRTGAWIYYNEDGIVKAKGDYIDGLKKGVWNYNIRDSAYTIDWNIYTNRPLKINVPDSWILREDMAPSVLLAGFSDSSYLGANFNILVLKKEKRSLDSIIKETVRDGKGELEFSIKILSTKDIEINGITGKEIAQHIKANGKDLIAVQYFLEKPDSVFLLSFFVDEKKEPLYKSLLREMAYSFMAI